jgi:hypothetical protein
MTRPARALFASLLASLALAIAPSMASADLLGMTNPVTDWSSVLPSLSPQFVPDDPNICTSGKPKCIDAVAKEMAKRYQPLSDSCSHNVMFALLYLRVTDHVGGAVWTPGRFDDPYFMTHYTAVFANLYFKGYDAWKASDPTTPVAWKIALDAAKNKQVSSLGNLLLGMNAHINRDLPFVLYSIGLRNPDGTSRKPDHDRINAVLYEAYDEAIAEGARRFDDSLHAYEGENASDSGIQSVILWREEAWRNAERLAAASSDAERALISQQIEQAANLEAQLIKAAYSYSTQGGSAATRDAYCAAHHNDL